MLSLPCALATYTNLQSCDNHLTNLIPPRSDAACKTCTSIGQFQSHVCLAGQLGQAHQHIHGQAGDLSLSGRHKFKLIKLEVPTHQVWSSAGHLDSLDVNNPYT